MESKVIKSIFSGHIVHCKDLDSLTEFNVEVLVNILNDSSKTIQLAESFAARHELVEMLSGNTFEFEYLQPSGKSVEITKTVTRLSPTNSEAEKLLLQHSLE